MNDLIIFKNNIKTVYANDIIALRGKGKMTQSEFAEYSDMCRKTINKLESGFDNYYFDTMIQIAWRSHKNLTIKMTDMI